jgi:ferric enterobactin receptor
MRLKVAIAKYILKPNRIRVCFFIIGFVVSHSTECKSQAYELAFRENVALSNALLQSSKTFGFKVAFDAQRLGAVHIDKIVKGSSKDEFVTNLLQNTGFTYIYKHGSYLIVEASTATPEIQNTCQLLGTTFDNETGEQLPYASVFLPSENISISTSTNGTFGIKNIVSNPIHVIINYIGYYPIDTLLSWNTPSIYHSFKLKYKVNVIDSVHIHAKRLEMVDYRGDVDFSTTINPLKLIDLPMLAETDIFKTLQLLPGINYSENTTELSIRGGTSDQNLVLFDGQTLYNLSHYYGVFSSINPYIVKDIQVFKGGFDSRYGERISGIVDITGKSGNRMKPSFIADFNLLSVNLAMEIPVSKKLTFVGAARRSYSDILKTGFAKNLFELRDPKFNEDSVQIVNISEPQFHFHDLNAKLNYRVNEDENISLSIYEGKDYFYNTYSYLVKSKFSLVKNTDSSSIRNYGFSVNWQKQWNSSSFSSVTIGSSGYFNESYNLTKIDMFNQDGPDQKFLPDPQNIFEMQNNNHLKDYFVSLQNTISINSYNQLNFGFLFRRNDIFYHKDADKKYVYDNANQSAWLSSVFIQDRVLLLKNLRIKPGIRLSSYAGNRQFYLEPRFAAKYDLTENFSLRMATGRYYQFIAQVNSYQETGYTKNFWVLANDAANPVIKSNHYILGMAYQYKNFLFDAEAYYKDNTGIQEYIYLSQYTRHTKYNDYFPTDQKPHPQPSYFINGSGKTQGIDFFVRYRNKNFTSWLSYTLSKGVQQFDSINLGQEIPAMTDQTHQISFSNLFSFGEWNIGAIALFSTGRPYISSSKNDNILPIKREYSRMPDFFRFDLSTNYNFKINSVRAKAGISIINLFNTQNYFDKSSRTFDFENSNFTETNMIPSQNLSLNLFLQISF